MNSTLKLLKNSIFVTFRKEGQYMVKVVLNDGRTLEGTPKQVKDMLELLGETAMIDPTKFYYSDTHEEFLLIRDMNSIHLRNATLKMQKEWLDSLYKITEPNVYARKVAAGITDPTFFAMMTELYSRVK